MFQYFVAALIFMAAQSSSESYDIDYVDSALALSVETFDIDGVVSTFDDTPHKCNPKLYRC